MNKAPREKNEGEEAKAVKTDSKGDPFSKRLDSTQDVETVIPMQTMENRVDSTHKPQLNKGKRVPTGRQWYK